MDGQSPSELADRRSLRYICILNPLVPRSLCAGLYLPPSKLELDDSL